MKDQSKKSEHPTSQDTPGSTSSPGSEPGTTPSDSPDGRKLRLYSPEAAHVSRFRALESERDTPIIATYGPLFTASSPTHGLQYALENRLMDLLDVNGSPECALTWKLLDMPSGVPVCQLQASARRTSATVYGLWPTMTATDGRRGTGKRRMEKKWGYPLSQRVAYLAMWETPLAAHSKAPNRSPRFLKKSRSLTPVEALVIWPTPTVRDSKDGSQRNMPAKSLLGRVVLSLPQPVWMEDTDGYLLNPNFTRWLLGLPAEYHSCVYTATQS